MPIQKLCTVAEAVRLNEFAWSLTLEAEGMEPQGPDQFVHVKCGHSRLLRRPISICDWGKNRLRIVFEVRGEGTAWLARRKAGDTLDVLGPLGRGFRIGREDRCLLVGGGIGVPPMLGCAKWTAGQSTAVLGFRSADRAMLTEEFQKSCKHITFAVMTGAWAGTALWTPDCGILSTRIKTLRQFWPAAPSPC